jgi:hypothetical protein
VHSRDSVRKDKNNSILMNNLHENYLNKTGNPNSKKVLSENIESPFGMNNFKENDIMMSD